MNRSTMTIKELEDNELVIIGRDGKPLTKNEREFLILIKKLEKQYGLGVVLAVYTLMEAAIKGPINIE